MNRPRKRNQFVSLFLGAVIAVPVAFVALTFMGKSPMPLIDQGLNKLPVEMVSWTGLRSAEPVVIGEWPPKKGVFYPDLILSDQNGDEVTLSQFAGKVILVELAAIPCKGCQAFAGGQDFGGFDGVPVQPGLSSIHHYAKQFAGVELGKDVVFVQLLLYSKALTSPSQADVTAWAKHFNMNRDENQIVLRGDPSMLGPDTYRLIPGFHLIDENFTLQYDSSGHQPEDDLYLDLLPALGKMVR